MALIGKVIAMTGVANILNDKGEKRALNPGDQIQTGDSIQTAPGVDVDVQLANGRVIHIGSDQLVAFTPELAEVFAPTEADSAINVATIDTVIQALENGQDINEVLEATAAGAGGGSDGSHSAVYLERINQALNGLDFPDEAGGLDNILLANSLVNAVAFVGNITSDTEAEGTSLTHTVTLENVLNSPQTFSFSITGATATAGEDFTSAFIFSDGVTFTPDADNPFSGTITVPAGVKTFTVTVPTVQDSVFEGNETYTINIGGATATGTITDDTDKPTVVSVEPGAVGVGDDAVPEGTPLVYTVTLSSAASVPATYTFVLNNGGTAEAGDIGAPVFSNGVTFDSATGLITVPAGVTSFSVTVPTIENNVYEGDETVPLTVEGVTGTGIISDEADRPTVVSVEPGAVGVSDDAVPEGTPLVYTVTLSNVSELPLTYPFVLNSGGTAEAGDIGAPVFSNGVTFDSATGLITVPAGVTSFSVTVPTIQDDIYEGNETVPLTVGGVTGTGTITDEADLPKVTRVEPGIDEIDVVTGLRVGSTVVEGDPADPLLYTVTLSNASSTATTVTLSLTNGTGIVGTDTTTPVQVSFDDGLTFSPVVGDTVSVPAGVTKFIISVPTFDDTIDEPTETILFTASTPANIADGDTPAAVEGRIIDNDSPVAVAPTGFIGEYFGYNDVVVAGNRVHADDGTVGNLNSIADISAIINGRNGASVVGTNAPSGEDVADVRFNVTSIYYGGVLAGADGDLGRNAAQTTGGMTLGVGNNLETFLGADAASAVVQAGSPFGGSSGLGKTTDAIIRMTGAILVDRGNYDFRVFADDGFRLKVGDQTLLEYDGNQSPTTRTFTNLNIEKGGLLPMELLYWEQGGDGWLRIEFKLSSSDTWLTLDSTNVSMFSTAEAAQFGTLTDTQEIYQDVDGLYKVREIGQGSGTDDGETINGTATADLIEGLGGNDTINGGAGDDALFGNDGDDTLVGGDGHDILDGGAGNDLMNGGAGDDIYVVDSATELANIIDSGGTDTIRLDVDFGAVTLASGFENADILHASGGTLTGNGASNRLTGGAGDDVIDGAAGDDRINGGQGGDLLTGGSGNDVFVWTLADKAPVGVDTDHITDFIYTGNGLGAGAGNAKTDSIDLRDLLQGESSTQVDTYQTPDIGNLLNYLNFTVDGASTVINVSSAGDGTVDHRIVLDDVNLFAATGSADQTALLQKILANGTLIVD